MYLLDTHTLIWALYDSSRLSAPAVDVLQKEKCCISIISLWEISIKKSLNKLNIEHSAQEIADFCSNNSIEILNITPKECDLVGQLPFVHRDPFDRLLIAQARCNDLIIITKDENIPKYEVNTLW